MSRATAGQVAGTLRDRRTPPQLRRMLATLTSWNPLYDRLVALWCATVDGPLPRRDGATTTGGLPGAVWPDGWAEQRAEWLRDVAVAARRGGAAGRHHRPRSTFTRLRRALEATRPGEPLPAATAGTVRHVLAGAVTRYGAPAHPPCVTCGPRRPEKPPGRGTPTSPPCWRCAWTATPPTRVCPVWNRSSPRSVPTRTTAP